MLMYKFEVSLPPEDAKRFETLAASVGKSPGNLLLMFIISALMDEDETHGARKAVTPFLRWMACHMANHTFLSWIIQSRRIREVMKAIDAGDEESLKRLYQEYRMWLGEGYLTQYDDSMKTVEAYKQKMEAYDDAIKAQEEYEEEYL